MRVCDPQRTVTPLLLNRLLQLCSKSKALNPAKQTHQQIIIYGLHENSFMITKLIQVYVEFSDIKSARKLLAKLVEPNVFVFTSILSYHCRKGNFNACLSGYYEMKSIGILPDHYVFPKVLNACAVFKSLEFGEQLHKDVIVCGVDWNIEVCNSLIDMYSKCGDVRSAKWIFDRMDARDLISWNTMISGYICNEIPDFPLEEMLDSIRLEGFQPDIVTWNTIMDAYCRRGNCDNARDIFRRIEEPNVISWTTLISGYSRIGKHDIALEIFSEIMSRGEGYVDVDCLSSILASCQQMGALRCGREVHGYGMKMDHIRCEFYNSAGPALLTMYAKCRRIRDAKCVFTLMDKSDVVTWNAMILGYVGLEMDTLAVDCLREMQSVDVKSDQTTISTLLPVCDLECGKQIHAYITKGGFSSFLLVGNALIHMYAKCGHVDAAKSIFSQMTSKDLVSYNTMIRGFGMHGFGQDALQLLQEMVMCSICPDSLTLTSILSACSHSGLVDEGLEIFYRMPRDFGFNPAMEHYTCVVDLLARAGRLDDAVDFISKMPLRPNGRIWGSVLTAALDHQNISIGILASEHLVQLEPENAGHFVTLSNMYARAGRLDDSLAVRIVMESRWLVKQIGLSQIKNAT